MDHGKSPGTSAAEIQIKDEVESEGEMQSEDTEVYTVVKVKAELMLEDEPEEDGPQAESKDDPFKSEPHPGGLTKPQRSLPGTDCDLEEASTVHQSEGTNTTGGDFNTSYAEISTQESQIAIPCSNNGGEASGTRSKEQVLETSHPNGKTHVDVICAKKLRKKRKPRKPIRQEACYNCQHCGKSYKDKYSYKRHVIAHEVTSHNVAPISPLRESPPGTPPDAGINSNIAGAWWSNSMVASSMLSHLASVYSLPLFPSHSSPMGEPYLFSAGGTVSEHRGPPPPYRPPDKIPAFHPNHTSVPPDQHHISEIAQTRSNALPDHSPHQQQIDQRTWAGSTDPELLESYVDSGSNNLATVESEGMNTGAQQYHQDPNQLCSVSVPDEPSNSTVTSASSCMLEETSTPTIKIENATSTSQESLIIKESVVIEHAVIKTENVLQPDSRPLTDTPPLKSSTPDSVPAMDWQFINSGKEIPASVPSCDVHSPVNQINDQPATKDSSDLVKTINPVFATYHFSPNISVTDHGPNFVMAPQNVDPEQIPTSIDRPHSTEWLTTRQQAMGIHQNHEPLMQSYVQVLSLNTNKRKQRFVKIAPKPTPGFEKDETIFQGIHQLSEREDSVNASPRSFSGIFSGSSFKKKKKKKKKKHKISKKRRKKHKIKIPPIDPQYEIIVGVCEEIRLPAEAVIERIENRHYIDDRQDTETDMYSVSGGDVNLPQTWYPEN